ncbi:hypothetical protein ACFSJS_23380 [Streptomyces desertarenae]|uniref:Uncharacterized protein n=1 Tax=Streptomyces desertarenae TaxID=2666184 RepID=A0ABW4PQM8_9ACTN
MEFVIDPPRGVPPVQIGMTYEQALSAVETWGPPKVSGPYAHTATVKIMATVETLDIVVHLEGGERVTAIELWRFENEEEFNGQVLLDGVDVFRSPAREILQHQREKGHTVDDADPENPVIPGVTLAFTRETGRQVPLDPDDGLPLHFTSVLVADEEYY